MAPIKFEDDFKEKLDKRTIAPSNEAWEKLSERLDSVDDSRNTNRFWWIGIAASIIGAFFVVSQFMNNETLTDAPIVVDAPENVETSEEKSIINQKELQDNETTVALEEIETDKNTTSNMNKPKTLLKETPVQLAEEKVLPKFKKDIEVLQDKKTVELTFETEKAQEVASIINTINENQKGVSDATIDSLLKQAQRDILLHRMKGEDQVLADAALLLQEVEFELDASFRDKVFKVLKDSYGTVKTAIAQRNE
ncbi:hypothetical protein [Algibacter sp. 2305UL17-15]|uniref:hypothetical protein n=1 Tax=Algibacter sp. 2305UL17-15 TaxID=3231268 RepID=UPI00345B0B24